MPAHAGHSGLMLADRAICTPRLDLVGNEFSKVGPSASDGSCRSICSNLSFRCNRDIDDGNR
jgi:hypothetical protein